MKQITLISILALISLSYLTEVTLAPFVEKFLKKMNEELSKKIEGGKKFGKVDTSYSITFDNLTENNFKAVLQQPDLIHITITDFKAKAEATMRAKVSIIPTIKVSADGEVRVSAEADIKIETKEVDGKKVKTGTLSGLKTNTNLALNFGKFKYDVFQGPYSSLKKLLEQKVGDRFLQKELQKIVDKSIDKFL